MLWACQDSLHLQGWDLHSDCNSATTVMTSSGHGRQRMSLAFGETSLPCNINATC